MFPFCSIFPSPLLPRGALMRRRDGGAGRRRDRRTGPQIRRSGAREIRAFDRCGARVVRLATGTRAASGLRPGAISPCQELADRRECRESAARRRKEERRSRAPKGAPGPRHGLGVSGDPETGVTARRATGAAFRTSACRRSAPLIFREEQKRTKGTRRPPQNRAMPLGCLTFASKSRASW